VLDGIGVSTCLDGPVGVGLAGACVGALFDGGLTVAGAVVFAGLGGAGVELVWAGAGLASTGLLLTLRGWTGCWRACPAGPEGGLTGLLAGTGVFVPVLVCA
jgi:hypothetical protein